MGELHVYRLKYQIIISLIIVSLGMIQYEYERLSFSLSHIYSDSDLQPLFIHHEYIIFISQHYILHFDFGKIKK